MDTVRSKSDSVLGCSVVTRQLSNLKDIEMKNLIACSALLLTLIAFESTNAQVYQTQQIYPTQQVVPGRRVVQPQAAQTPRYYNVTLTEEQKAKPSLGASFYDTGRGVGVRSVYTNSPAQKAGINSGDLITKVNGRPASTAAALNAAIEGAAAGTKIKLTKRTSAGKESEVECGSMTMGQIIEVSTVPEAGVFDTALVQAQVNLKKMANNIRNAETELADMKKRYASLEKQIADLKAKAAKAREAEEARKAKATK